MNKQELINDLKKNLPLLISRKEVPKILGGLISSRALANLDSMGKGPGKIKFGARTVIYTRDSLISWIVDRIQNVEDGSSVCE